MYYLGVLLIAIVGVFLFFNLYARKRLLSSYKKLQKANIEFEMRHVFNKELRENEIHSKYPDHIEEIERFCTRIRKSIRYAVILFLIIAGLGLLIFGMNR
jgi:hypothetical protein